MTNFDRIAKSPESLAAFIHSLTIDSNDGEPVISFPGGRSVGFEYGDIKEWLEEDVSS